MSEVRIDRICYSLADAAVLMSVGKRSLYREIHDGRLRVIKLGRRTLVSADAIRDFIEAASKPAKLTKARL
jgi:excisionase family DNA binding protein